MHKETYNGFSKFDIIGFTETFLIEAVDIDIPNYTWTFCPATPTNGRPSGGLLLGSQNGRKIKLVHAGVNTLISEIAGIIYILCYFKPGTPVEDIMVEVSEHVDLHSAKPTLVFGDFNCRTDKGERSQLLQEGMFMLGLYLLNDCGIPTYITSLCGKSTIDLVFCKVDMLISAGI